MEQDQQNSQAAPTGAPSSKASELEAIVAHVAQIHEVPESNIAALFAPVATRCDNFVNLAADRGYEVAIVSTFRTAEEQNELYAKGRTAPGEIVTNAMAYQSYHNYGLAFDISATRKDGQAIEQADWATLGEIGEGCEFVWGGTFGDDDHFEYHPDFTWEDLKPLLDPSASAA